MKKVIILSGILCLLASFPANARISLNLNLGEPAPAYVEAPYYVQAPVYPTYAVEGGRYHEVHDRRRGPDRGHYRGR
jgi:hypothetical protein